MKLAVAFVCLLALASAAPSLPQFGQNFVETEKDDMVMHQGQYLSGSNQLCCAPGDNCEIQTESQQGTNYISYKQQKSRFEPINGGSQAQTIVTYYGNNGKEMVVTANNTCQMYCPVSDPLYKFELNPNSTYVGQETVNGKVCDIWQFNETFPLDPKIVMQSSNVYVDQSVNPPVPVQEIDILTPFGMPIGQQTNVFQSWSYEEPPASKLTVNGVDECPMASNCNQQSKQMMRLRMRMWNTFAFYQWGEGAQ